MNVGKSIDITAGHAEGSVVEPHNFYHGSVIFVSYVGLVHFNGWLSDGICPPSFNQVLVA